MKPLWDIFCSVVDNYGDIGVTWRLARQLVAEHGLTVRLWVDDLAAFAHLCPGADATAACQWQQGVEVRHWPDDWQPVEPATVVIEAFACNLPAAYVQAMITRPRPPLWLNLEYLSAEEWVAGCHGLPSPQAGGLQKFFFFPGFGEGSGGLLREAGLIERRQSFQGDEAARAAFLARLGVMLLPGERLISLFAYENPALRGWLDELARDVRPTRLLVPEGRIVDDLARWLGVADLAPGDQHRRGALAIQVLPFIEQDDYDRLLWCCEFNAVRGEDSFLRGQWAGRLLLWHIYQQEQGAHWDKLDAFLGLYIKELSAGAGAAITQLWHAWNGDGDMAVAWPALAPHWPELHAHAERWCLQQASQTDLAARLVHFYTNWL